MKLSGWGGVCVVEEMASRKAPMTINQRQWQKFQANGIPVLGDNQDPMVGDNGIPQGQMSRASALSWVSRDRERWSRDCRALSRDSVQMFT